MINSGWLCPRCDKINSPSVRQCNCTAVAVIDTALQKQLAEYEKELKKWNPFDNSSSIIGPASKPIHLKLTDSHERE